MRRGGGHQHPRHLVRHDGFHACADRPARHAAGPAARIRRKSRRDVRAVERPHGPCRSGLLKRFSKTLEDRLYPLLRRHLFVRMGVGQGAALPAQRPVAKGQDLLVGGALRLDMRPAGGRHHAGENSPQPLRGRPQSHVARGVGRAPAVRVPDGRRPAAGHLRGASVPRNRHGRCAYRELVRRMGVAAGAATGHRHRHGGHRLPRGSRRRGNRTGDPGEGNGDLDLRHSGGHLRRSRRQGRAGHLRTSRRLGAAGIRRIRGGAGGVRRHIRMVPPADGMAAAPDSAERPGAGRTHT